MKEIAMLVLFTFVDTRTLLGALFGFACGVYIHKHHAQIVDPYADKVETYVGLSPIVKKDLTIMEQVVNMFYTRPNA